MSMLTFIVFQPLVQSVVNTYYYRYGKISAVAMLAYYCLDFSTSFYKAYEEKENRLENNSADYAQLTLKDIVHNGND